MVIKCIQSARQVLQVGPRVLWLVCHEWMMEDTGLCRGINAKKQSKKCPPRPLKSIRHLRLCRIKWIVKFCDSLEALRPGACLSRGICGSPAKHPLCQSATRFVHKLASYSLPKLFGDMQRNSLHSLHLAEPTGPPIGRETGLQKDIQDNRKKKFTSNDVTRSGSRRILQFYPSGCAREREQAGKEPHPLLLLLSCSAKRKSTIFLRFRLSPFPSQPAQ